VRHRAPRVTAAYKRIARIAGVRQHPLAWLDEVDYAGLGAGVQIIIERDGVWLHDTDGRFWRHIPAVHSPFVGLEAGGSFEGAEIDYLASVLSPGAVMIDVGANIGLIAVSLAKRIPDVTIHAIEPVSRTFSALVSNVERNGVERAVRAARFALTDAGDPVVMTTTLNAANHAVPVGRRPGPGEEAVPATTLDAYARDLHRLDVLKLDVEGLEKMVLNGGRSTIAAHRPVIVMEIESRWTRRYGYDAEDIFDLLGELGYRHQRIVAGEVRPTSGSIASDLADANNFIFTCDDTQRSSPSDSQPVPVTG
jgi:FkbM family methyltransferase